MKWTFAVLALAGTILAAAVQADDYCDTYVCVNTKGRFNSPTVQNPPTVDLGEYQRQVRQRSALADLNRRVERIEFEQLQTQLNSRQPQQLTPSYQPSFQIPSYQSNFGRTDSDTGTSYRYSSPLLQNDSSSSSFRLYNNNDSDDSLSTLDFDVEND